MRSQRLTLSSTPPLSHLVNIAASELPGAAIASSLRWWEDAGVDVLTDEAPRVWLATHAEREKTPVPIVAAKVSAAPLPDTLEPFLNWLTTSATVPEAGPPRNRLRASGNPQGGLMIMADMPEREDAETGQLLSGAPGALFDAMIGALGLDRSAIWLASLCPGRPASAQLSAAGLDVLGPIALHHIRLIAPKRLWLMGQATSRALLGLDMRDAQGKLHNINLDGVMITAIATAPPRMLAEHPKMKAAVWADMQRLMAETPK